MINPLKEVGYVGLELSYPTKDGTHVNSFEVHPQVSHKRLAMDEWRDGWIDR
jgi:hypothetical protein